MLKNKNKGFSLVEIVVVIAIMVVLLAVLSPFLLKYVENSRMQRDDSAMDEVCNAVHLAMADSNTFDEVFSYSIPNNYVTYTDSSGVYGARYTDEEFWAPDGGARAVTITFNPNENGEYVLAEGNINNMTYGNGSLGEPRTTDMSKICKFENMGNQKLYTAVKKVVDNTISEKSATYKNSSYTVFISFKLTDGIYRAEVNGSYNGTNLSPDCPAAPGAGTPETPPEATQPEETPNPGGGENIPPITDSDLVGGGSISVPTPTPEQSPTHTGSLPCGHPTGTDGDHSELECGHFACEECDCSASINRIPVGATYTMADGTVLNPGDPFPETTLMGDRYRYGDYEYGYNCYCPVGNLAYWFNNESQQGWGVTAILRTQTSYGPILESINGHPITNMEYTFGHCSKMTTAPEIPQTVTNMKHTFTDCESLITAPAIPSSVTNMVQAFYQCESLKTAPDMSNATSITNMSHTFDYCTALTTVPNIGNATQLTSLPSTFKNCKALTDASGLDIPNSVTHMENTFEGCISLMIAPTIPSNARNMLATFHSCKSLTQAPEIPNRVYEMKSTFYGCTSLTNAPAIPDSVTSMFATFKGCTSLTTAPTIPNSVKDMYSVFYNCTSLTGTITINTDYATTNSGYTSYSCDSCFKNVDFEAQNITLTGSSTKLDLMGATGINYCVDCNGKCQDTH